MRADRSARALALAALGEWRRGRHFADAILQRLLGASGLSDPDRAFVTELVYGVLRSLSLLDFWLAQLRSRSLDDHSRDLLRLGLYQLLCLQIAEHAAVFETVAVAPKTSRALINGVLRNALRRRDELKHAAAETDVAIRASHPGFLIDRWTDAFGVTAAEQMCEWDNTPPLVYCRVNTLKARVDGFVAADSTREPLPDRSNFVRLAHVPIEALERGECYIQDPSTSVACELLDPQPGETVLDACAAPGGKTGYVAALMKNSGTLIACDREPERLRLLASNLQRLDVSNARIVQQDWAAEISPALATSQFDRILVDAPCSNTGVMRRRVDVRWRLRPDDFARMANEQIKILRALVPLLKPGGTLVYSTCSIEHEENAGVAASACAVFPSLRLQEERTLLPFRDRLDGAYAAKFVTVA